LKDEMAETVPNKDSLAVKNKKGRDYRIRGGRRRKRRNSRR